MNNEMKEQLVSIITPLYNKEKYIEETIKSVQNQTYRDWEMIIIDDCSTDAGAEIVQRLCKNDSRIRFVKNQNNLGAARSRNKAIDLARGRYVAFLDADDLWVSSKLERQISYMKERSCAFCFSSCGVVDENSNREKNVRKVPDVVDFHTLLKGNVIPCLTVVLDRKEFSRIEMPQIGHEDYALWLKLLQQGKMAYGINEVLAYYREYVNSLSGNKMMAAKWTWNIYRNYLKLGYIKSFYYFINYLYHAVKKRV